MSAGNVYAPVLMLRIQLAVRAYHLRLEPYTELKTYLVYLVYKVLKTAFYLVLVHKPVAQGRFIIVSVTEPAVVHDEHLDSGFLSLSCYIKELVRVKVEIGRFPVINKYRTAHILPLSSDKVVPHYIVEVSRHLT